MRSPVCELFGIETPIFAFSHCRDVVVEASRAGGLGVLGTAHFSPEELERELRWIDAHVEGRPYGLDLLMPSSYAKVDLDAKDTSQLIPEGHRAFMADMLAKNGVPPTERNERTGEFTPPGITACARAKSSSLRLMLRASRPSRGRGR